MKVLTSLALLIIFAAGCSNPPENRIEPAATTQSETTKQPVKDSPTEPPSAEKCVTLSMRDMDIQEVIALIAKTSGKRIIASSDVKGKLSGYLENVPWEDALVALVKTLGYKTVTDDPGTIRIVRSE